MYWCRRCNVTCWTDLWAVSTVVVVSIRSVFNISTRSGRRVTSVMLVCSGISAPYLLTDMLLKVSSVFSSVLCVELNIFIGGQLEIQIPCFLRPWETHRFSPPHHPQIQCLGGVMVTASALHSTDRGFDSQPFNYQVVTLGKLFTHMCLCHQAVQFGTGQRAVMPYGWEGNRRPGVALAMRHSLQWFIHLRAQRLWEGDEHPTYAPEGQGRLYLFAQIQGYACPKTRSQLFPFSAFGA